MSHNETSFRWWEFYVIRYGMGSVVGAVIFFFLCNTNPVLKSLLFGAEAGKIDGTLLVLLAGYGLAYCYIASAPILVFHMGRYLLKIDNSVMPSFRRMVILLVVPLAATIYFLICSATTGVHLWVYALIFALSVLVFWSQFLVVFITIFKSERLFFFYNNLAIKRSIDTIGIVDSYKHLREHGNSFAIVVFEIVLAFILFVAGNLEFASTGIVSQSKYIYVFPYILIIFLWILPAALVWFIGTLFERQFGDS
ncbi:MAG: hypothetical protein CVV12_11225 [Gammaproteobacteria bacterium HGW-Gammaproteobacteria-2]|jgi:hypothetical protein|nr:MAG: hypothetical protein CVV12_11225 [Gammaproteobacteria bacterium HGW-Gammaproteobacteria-2]